MPPTARRSLPGYMGVYKPLQNPYKTSKTPYKALPSGIVEFSKASANNCCVMITLKSEELDYSSKTLNGQN